jgi:flavin-dependent dehydrogenase
MKRTDVVIIGGSLAGAACVRELARRGIDAVAFERARFPREKVCGGFLSPGAVELLDELGMLDRVRSAGAVDVRSARLLMRDAEVRVPFSQSGMGISRRTLDGLMAEHPGVQQGAVQEVRRCDYGFRVQLDGDAVCARVVIDAAGKQSRFGRQAAASQFGIQFYDPEPRGDVLDFWFFEEGYGGAVTVDGGRSNACFLVCKEALPRYLSKAACVTGPVAYTRTSSDFIAIGDAAGMVDPFCGEGIRHALDTGLLAAVAVAKGLASGASYESMRGSYESAANRRWARKRRLGRWMRTALKHSALAAAGLRVSPEYWLRKLWE